VKLPNTLLPRVADDRRMLVTLSVFIGLSLASACVGLALAWILRGHVAALYGVVVLSLSLPAWTFTVHIDWSGFALVCLLVLACVVLGFLGFVAAAFIDSLR